MCAKCVKETEMNSGKSRNNPNKGLPPPLCLAEVKLPVGGFMTKKKFKFGLNGSQPMIIGALNNGIILGLHLVITSNG